MKLEKCKACGHVVSKKAKKCPNCGEPQKRESVGCMSAVGIVILALVAAVIFIQEKADKITPRVLTAEEQKAEDLFALRQIEQYQLEEAVKASLKDPSSYERVKVQFEDRGDKGIYMILTYRAKNSFGARVIERAGATFSPNGLLIDGPKILDQ